MKPIEWVFKVKMRIIPDVAKDARTGLGLLFRRKNIRSITFNGNWCWYRWHSNVVDFTFGLKITDPIWGLVTIVWGPRFYLEIQVLRSRALLAVPSSCLGVQSPGSCLGVWSPRSCLKVQGPIFPVYRLSNYSEAGLES